MLQNLDTVIAFSVVMLLLSLVITTVVQMVVSIFGLRGRQLLWGLGMLFQQVDKELAKDEDAAQFLARQVLTHPALAPSNNLIVRASDWLVKKLGLEERLPILGGKRPPTAITLEDVQLVLESLESQKELNAELESWIARLPDDARTAVNGLLGSSTESKKRLEKWFATVMDATSERFKLQSRWITAAGAILLAFGFQVDSGDILRQLNADPEIRAGLVAQAEEIQGVYNELQNKKQYKKASKQLATLNETLEDLDSKLKDSRLAIFRPIDEWEEVDGPEGEPALDKLKRRAPLVWQRLWDQSPGTVITALLLSLGAPFWYRVLANFLSFRSIVTRKQGQGRQTEDEAAGG